MGYWIETLTSQKQSPGMTAHCAEQLADRRQQQRSLLGERGCVKEATSDRRKGHQFGLSVTGRPEAGAGGMHVGSY